MKKKDKKIIFYVFVLFFVFFNFIITIIFGTVYLKGWGKWELIAKIPDTPRQIGESILRFAIDIPYLKYRFKKQDLSVYELFVDHDDWNDLVEALPDPKSPGYVNIITSSNKIKRPAKLRFEDKEYDIKMGFSGMGSGHWLWQKKSMKIKFIDWETSVEDIGNFRLVTPHERQFALDYFNNYRAKKLGLFVPESEFVWLKVNGKDHGVYYKINDWDENFLKKNGLDPDSNMYGEELYKMPLFLTFAESFQQWDKKTYRKDRPKDDFSDLAELLDIINSPDEIFYNKIWDIVDRDNFLNWMLHSSLSGSYHQDRSHNVRLYFDKTKQKFIFFPIDVDDGDIDENFLFKQYNPIVNRVILDKEFLFDFELALWNYVIDKKNIEDDLIKYNEISDLIKMPLYQDRFDEFNSRDVDRAISHHQSILENNFYTIKNILDKSEVYSILTLDRQNDRSVIDVDAKVKSNAIIGLNSISLEGITEDNHIFQLYSDTNDSFYFDSEDEYLGTFVYNRGKYEVVGLDQKLYPNFVIPFDDDIDILAAPPITLDFSQKKFFVTIDLKGDESLEDIKVKLDYKNLVTGEDVRVDDERYLYVW